jgi:Zn-dependent peptidase ImmA (M78 family)
VPKRRNEKSPEQVLSECRIATRPIPLQEILDHYGIQQVELPAGEDVFGAIVRQNGRVVIAFNPAQHPNRRRFTVAHELGHYFCHYQDVMEHVDGDFRVHWRDTESSSGVKWDEIEANRFAAALLMPEHMLRVDVNNCRVLDGDAVQRLANLYKVSRLAMQFRLINLGLLPPDVDPSAEF